MNKIYIDGKKVSLRKALKILSDDYIDGGNCCDQTTIDLRDAAIELVKEQAECRKIIVSLDYLNIQEVKEEQERKKIERSKEELQEEEEV